MSRIMRILTLGMVYAIVSPYVCGAQDSVGLPPRGSFSQPSMDTINLSNLNVHIEVPLFSKTTRGPRIPFVYLKYDGNPYTTSNALYSSVNTEGTVGPVVGVGHYPNPGAPGYSTYTTPCDETYPDGPFAYTYGNWTETDSNGTPHEFNVSSTDNGDCGGGVTTESGYAIDGSGNYITVSGTQYTLIDAGGLQPNYPGQFSPVDTNGNKWAYLGGTVSAGYKWQDPSGATVTLTEPDTLHDIYAYTDTSGTSQQIVVAYQQFTLMVCTAADACSGESTRKLVVSVTRPDGSSYQFTYEPTPGYPGDVTGRLASITLPTGGSIGYQYTGGYDGFSVEDGNSSVNTSGIIRTTSDGSTTYSRSATTYLSCPQNLCETVETTIQDGQGNQTIVDFSQSFQSLNFLETKRRVYQGDSSSGTLLLTRMRCYNGDTGDCTTQPIPPETQDVSQVTETVTPGGGAQSEATTTYYNAMSLPTEVDEFDYGATSPSRTTLTSYATLGNNIQNRPSSVDVTDGSGNTIQFTSFGYDETSVSPAPPNLTNLQSVSGSRGNLTSIHKWVGDGTYLTTTFAYDAAGALTSSAGPNGTTTYGYDSSDTYVTSTTDPVTASGVTLTSTATWDASTGLETSATDPNGVRTQIGYDGMLRPAEVDRFDPNGGMVGKLTYSYSANQVGMREYQNASAYSDTEIQQDGYGRTIREAVANGQAGSSWYQQDTCYGSNGLIAFQAYQYQGTGVGGAPVCSGAGDTFTYDALGRTTQVHHGDGTAVNNSYFGAATKTIDERGVTRISQSNGLGQLAGLCEVSSNSSMPGSGAPTSCGMDIAANGFLTSFSYDLSDHITTIAQGVQRREFQTDALGRPTLTVEPESGQTTYSYQYNSNGLQVTRTRPQANQSSAAVTSNTVTQYDALGRVLLVSYSDGTPGKSYTYDSNAGWNAPTQTYLKGRLSLASVGNAQTVFSYDAAGNVSALGECTPSMCGANAVVMSYSPDWLGNTITASDGFGQALTYSYSPANEVQSITSSINDSTHPPNLVSSVQNGPFGPLAWQLGNGLTGVRQYDSMGRVTGGWVCRGSSQPSCSGGTQVYGFADAWVGTSLSWACDTVINNCSSYTYDDFGRLSSLDVYQGAGSNYTYVYDRWGNRWNQSGSLEADYNFDTSKNQVQQTGFGYDAAGNLTSLIDALGQSHTLKYDADGNLTQVDNGITSSYTYDALNQRVRASNEGEDTLEYFFNSNGQRSASWDVKYGWENAGSSYWGSAPIEFYFNGQAQYQHQDWLGTERMVTDYTGNVQGAYTSNAFGDGYAVNGVDYESYHFGTLDQDSSLPTDHAQFRQYHPTTGRWMSPDGFSGSYNLSNPQSLNRYTYAMNNPLSYIDPSGQECVWDDGSYDAADDPNTGSARDCSDLGGTWIELSAFETIEGVQPGTWSNKASSSVAFDWLTPSAIVTSSQLPLSAGPNFLNGAGAITMQASAAPNKFAKFMNCVANGANKASLAALLPQNAPSLLKNLAGNDFASLQQLALGPNRGNALISIAEGKGTNAVAQGIGTLAWGADRFILGTNGAGTTYALDMIPGTIATTAAGVFIADLSAAKGAYDLGSYLAGFGTCAIVGR